MSPNILVIHPNDDTTEFLSASYDNIISDTLTVVRDPKISKSQLRRLISENDIIVMLGHGSSLGLMGEKRLLIDSKMVASLRTKVCFCIWCHGATFFRKYQLNGCYTGMFISQEDEAKEYAVDTTSSQITASNSALAVSLSMLIGFDTDLQKQLVVYYQLESDVNDLVWFNINGMI